MKLSAHHNLKRRDRGDAELTPLINVVFLLLIFVVLAGEVIETAPFKVSPPDASAASATASDMTSIYLGADGQIFAAGRVYAPGDVAGAIAALPVPKPTDMVVEADRGVEAATAMALIDQLQKTEIERIRLITSAGDG